MTFYVTSIDVLHGFEVKGTTINDAFEVAILNADGQPVRPTFAPGRDARHWWFDLPGYCARRLRGLAEVDALDADTAADEERFFSHRRRTLSGGGPIGHQLSVVVL